jgi:hypothetical protein
MKTTIALLALLSLESLACGPAPTYITNDIIVMGDSGPAQPDAEVPDSADTGTVLGDAQSAPETSLPESDAGVPEGDAGDPGDAMTAPETSSPEASPPDAGPALCCELYSTPPLDYPCPVKGEGIPDAGNFALTCFGGVGSDCQVEYNGEIMGWNVAVCP